MKHLPDRSPMLGDANFPGALTVLRHGFGTPDETAAWLINGDFYRDHYHCDFGAVMLYALGSPISVHWGSLYEPRLPGAWMQNVVVPEAALETLVGTVPTSPQTNASAIAHQIISGSGTQISHLALREPPPDLITRAVSGIAASGIIGATQARRCCASAMSSTGPVPPTRRFFR